MLTYKNIYGFLAILLITASSVAVAQNTEQYNIKLRNGNVSLSLSTTDQWAPSASEITNNRYYRVVQFSDIPSVEDKLQMKTLGLNLMDYLPNYAFYASISVGTTLEQFDAYGLRSVMALDETFKLHPMLYQKNYPEWSKVGSGSLLVNVIFHRDVNYDHARETLRKSSQLEIVAGNASTGRLTLEVSQDELSDLANQPFIMFIEPIDEPAEPENYTARTLHRSNVIAGDAVTSRKYDGTGITLGMHDDGIIGPHIDYEGRLPIQYPTGNNGDHGDHVAGTIMGAGNLNPLNKGMAFGADLFVYGSSNNNYDSVGSHYTNHDVIITSKSYSNGCNSGYTNLSRELDQYVRQYPSLMHVFSAGNDGTSDCNYGAGANWGNITGGHKAGKNVIAVANLTATDGLATSSSRGPAADGRIKPDVAAKGTQVMSTTNPNNYVSKTGTSMSCPGVSGSLAQLYHAYTDINGNFPKSGLMKGVMMNTADDLGNPGPDFRYGWGRINVLRAVEVIENNQYVTGTIIQGDTNYHDIFVPNNVKQLKVMVYWNDYEGSSAAATALVNNIDFRLEDAANVLQNPWVLDPTPTVAALNSNAVQGVDDLNNVEQVTIDNPTNGIHTANVIGKIVPQGPQEYFVVYSFVMDEITVTYPNGGEPFSSTSSSGFAERIRWDAPEGTGNFTIEYSTDNGSNWTTAGTAISSRRYYDWTVPAAVTGEALVRVSRGANMDESDTSFSIINVPENLRVDWSCPDSVRLRWSNVNSATSYEVSRLGAKYMDSVGTSTINSIVLTGINPNEEAWFSVKAMGMNGAVGRRAIAIEKPLGTFNCPISDDASVNMISSPVVSLPDCKDNSNLSITVVIKNEGLNDITNIPVSYQIDNGPVVSETFSGTLMSLDTSSYTFTVEGDFNSLSSYEIKAWTGFGSDQNEYNDTASKKVASFGSAIVTLPWSENFETFSTCGTFNNCEGTTCNLRSGWYNHENLDIDDIDWRTDDGGTRTFNTGPDEDHNPGTDEGNYLYTEVSGECFNKESFLITPCIDLNGTKGPEFSFWYHMNGIDIGSLSVDVLHNGRWELNKIRYTSQRGDIWRQATVDLAEYAGDTVNIRFRAMSQEGPFGDIAIDDISAVETDSTVGIDESELQVNSIKLFPNPASDKLFVEYNKEMSNERLVMKINDLQGRVVMKKELMLDDSNLRKEIDLSSFDRGVYLVNLEIAGEVLTEKVILQ